MSNITGNKRATRSREVDDSITNTKKATTSIIDDSLINSNYQLTVGNYADLDVIQASTTGDQENGSEDININHDAGYDSPAKFRKHVRIEETYDHRTYQKNNKKNIIYLSLIYCTIMYILKDH